MGWPQRPSGRSTAAPPHRRNTRGGTHVVHAPRRSTRVLAAFGRHTTPPARQRFACRTAQEPARTYASTPGRDSLHTMAAPGALTGTRTCRPGTSRCTRYVKQCRAAWLAGWCCCGLGLMSRSMLVARLCVGSRQARRVAIDFGSDESGYSRLEFPNGWMTGNIRRRRTWSQQMVTHAEL